MPSLPSPNEGSRCLRCLSWTQRRRGRSILCTRIDASTGLRSYNPEGQRVVEVTELLEITHAERIQIVARIDPDLRKVVGRVMKRQKTTLNALVETALRAHGAGRAAEPRREIAWRLHGYADR